MLTAVRRFNGRPIIYIFLWAVHPSELLRYHSSFPGIAHGPPADCSILHSSPGAFPVAAHIICAQCYSLFIVSVCSIISISPLFAVRAAPLYALQCCPPSASAPLCGPQCCPPSASAPFFVLRWYPPSGACSIFMSVLSAASVCPLLMPGH